MSPKKASVLAPFLERKVVAASSVCHHGNSTEARGLLARARSALNMLCTPYTRDILDFNEPSRHPRIALATLGTIQMRRLSGSLKSSMSLARST